MKRKYDKILFQLKKILFLLGVIIVMIVCLFYIKGVEINDKKRFLLHSAILTVKDHSISSIQTKSKQEASQSSVKTDFLSDILRPQTKSEFLFEVQKPQTESEFLFEVSKPQTKPVEYLFEVKTISPEKDVSISEVLNTKKEKDKNTDAKKKEKDLIPEADRVNAENLCMTRCYKALTDKNSEQEGQCIKLNGTRGAGQKVISFSFYGELKSAYYNGISENLNSIDDYYPGWLMRLYLDHRKLDPDSATDLCQLSCASNRLDLCPVTNIPDYGDVSAKFGMVWRFLPISDPLVYAMSSRDLDSRFTLRESAAVKDWLKSGLAFHAMRDNPYHGTHILGGMWGARMDLGHREEFSAMIHNMINGMGTGWQKGYDQALLSEYVWPKVKDLSCVHDSFTCTRYPTQNTRAWPTKRLNEPGNFVGSIGDMKITTKCPFQCRPPDHQDWLYC